MTTSEQLHLPDLLIEGFRGIEALEIPRLGRVTLLAGENAVGKTTVLEAVRVYASRSNYRVLSDLLTGREEISHGSDEDGDPWQHPNWPALFHGRGVSLGTRITVGSGGKELTIEVDDAAPEDAKSIGRFFFDIGWEEYPRVLRVTFEDRKWVLPILLENGGDGSDVVPQGRGLGIRNRPALRGSPPAQLMCNSLGPSTLTNTELARYWDEVALTPEDDRAARALRLVLGEGVDRVVVVGNGRKSRLGGEAVVKLQRFDRPVPLKSLGDGSVRLYGLALALANSKGGLLLIDEAENGIHHTVQPAFWRMVLQTALENNVQVLATTHSWDCVTGFAEAAAENQGAEGVLVRLEREGERLRAVEYSEETLRIASEQGIEVR